MPTYGIYDPLRPEPTILKAVKITGDVELVFFKKGSCLRKDVVFILSEKKTCGHPTIRRLTPDEYPTPLKGVLGVVCLTSPSFRGLDKPLQSKLKARIRANIECVGRWPFPPLEKAA